MEAEASPSQIKFFDRTRGRVFMHPTSVNFSGKKKNGRAPPAQISTAKFFLSISQVRGAWRKFLVFRKAGREVT